LSRRIPHIENLINLDQLVGARFDIWALPLKLLGGDGSPTRAVAVVYD
jgi:kynurenine formamidase